MPSEHLRFPGSQGHELDARFDRPSGPFRGCALFAHCFSCSKDTHAASRISRALAQRGIAVLRFDFTGLGASEGEFSETNFSSNVADIVAAARYLSTEYGPVNLLVGHSLGGAGVLAAAAEIPEANAVATIGAPSDPAHVENMLGEAVEEIAEQGEAQVDLAGRAFVIQKQFLDDIQQYGLVDKVAHMRKALMIFHAPADTIVSIDHAGHIFQAAKHPKSFVSLDGADHLLTRRQDSEFVAGMLSAWLEPYLKPDEEDLPETGQVVVREAPTGRFTQEIRAGRHRLFGDEPVAVGGDDAGPSPYDYLLVSLGTCTAMTLRLYADRKKLPLEQVTVELAHDKIHAKDCEECEIREGRIDHIDLDISIKGDLDDAQRARMLEIADMCPVHRTLESEIHFTTREKTGTGTV